MRYQSMECPHCGKISGEVGKVYHTIQRLISNGSVNISGVRLARLAKVKVECIYMHIFRLRQRKLLIWKTGKGGQEFNTYYIPEDAAHFNKIKGWLEVLG